MKCFLFFSFLFLTFTPCFSQNKSKAEKYFSIIHQAETKFIQKDIDSALFFYKEAFCRYDAPFIKNLCQATVVASFNIKKKSFYQLLEWCLKRGMSEYEMKKIFDNRFKNDSTYLSIKKNYNYFHSLYLKSIDTSAYNVFEKIDRIDQRKTQEAIKLNRVQDEKTRGIHLLTKRYIKAVKKYGWPIETKVGIGNIVVGGTMTKKQIANLALRQRKNIVYSKFDSVLCKNQDDRFILVSNKNLYTSIIYQNSRKGNGFLWHAMGFDYNKLNDFILKGVRNLKINPTFVAQAIERSQTDSNDCLLGIGSNYFREELRYKRRKKYRLPSQISSRFDAHRKKYFIRSIEKEKKLLLTLYEYISGKPQKKISKHFIKKNLWLIKLFTNPNVG